MTMTWEEYKAYKKEQWWTLHQDMGWCIHVKKRCPRCGKTFTCHDCYVEYYLCWAVSDWRSKTSCDCPECLKKALGVVT